MTAQSELIWTLLAAFGPILAAAQSFDTGHPCGSRGQKNETNCANS